MNSGNIIPYLLRAAPVVIAVWILILSIRAWRKPRPPSEGEV